MQKEGWKKICSDPEAKADHARRLRGNRRQKLEASSTGADPSPNTNAAGASVPNEFSPLWGASDDRRYPVPLSGLAASSKVTDWRMVVSNPSLHVAASVPERMQDWDGKNENSGGHIFHYIGGVIS